jgi:hypothetical protein
VDAGAGLGGAYGPRVLDEASESAARRSWCAARHRERGLKKRKKERKEKERKKEKKKKRKKKKKSANGKKNVGDKKEKRNQNKKKGSTEAISTTYSSE